MATKLSLYNGALMVLGERKLAGLTENREPRRVLDDVWSRNPVRDCLSKGQWNFAIRSMEYHPSPSLTPQFGREYAYDKPTDWVRTAALTSDELFENALDASEARDEAGFWFADIDPLYVRYVSDDTLYGGDLSLWPENFARYVEHYVAEAACIRITANRNLHGQIVGMMSKHLQLALGTDAVDQGHMPLPPGSWSRARHRGSTGGYGDRGKRSRLIG